jgi:hypothetical protein
MDANFRPIQSPNITRLRYAIAVIYGFREMLLTILGASDVGRLSLTDGVMADSYKRVCSCPKQKGEVALYIYIYGVVDEFVISI